ncbi:MAG: tyrosine-type recombinase/integrase [Clostridia bacterium]|nr:tyrosine-type recombinase/integrase [Clostridia bacterium]
MPYTIDLNEFSPVLREFADYKSAIQNCSQKTVSEYMTDLRTFFRYIIAKRRGIDPDSEDFLKIDLKIVDLEMIQSIGTMEIYSFLKYAGDDRGNNAAARSRKLSAIKALYKYYVNKKHAFKDNPTADIESPKKKKALPKVMSLDESLTLLQAVKNDEMSKTRIRDYCIITLFLNCGMRLSELAGIKITDIDSELRSLRVTGKGSKERIIYLNDACRMALGDYLTERLDEKYRNIETKALFLSGRGRNDPISVKTVQWMVKKYLDLAGLSNRGYSVHKLRHTAATLMYQSGHVDVRTLKDILGHEQLNTTQIYTHVSNQSMEEAMAQNPLASVKPPKIHELKKIENSEDETDT